MVVPGTIFEELGFNYIGPIDGHDVNGVVDTLRNMRKFEGPQLLHVVTKKGKVTRLPKKTQSNSMLSLNLTLLIMRYLSRSHRHRRFQQYLGNGFAIWPHKTLNSWP